MVDRLSLVYAFVLAALLTATLSASAQSVAADPFRPPPGVADPSSGAGEVGGPVLQSVLIPKKGRPVAIIGGQQVRLGEAYGESRLVRLSEREAVLEGPEGIERLMLTPGVEKTDVITKTLKKTPVARRARSGE